ncbi:MAG: PKD domain-containing protein [Holophagales bacterium]|nr:PKD domain-containing protein [Holophagales bacterium]
MSRAPAAISRNRPAFTLLLLLPALAAALPAPASDNGYTGRTATTSAGCGSCHGTLSGTTTVVLSGPSTLAPGATGSYTCVVTHSPAYSGTNSAGIDIAVKTSPNGSVDAGTLAASGADLKESGSELTHPSPKTLSGSPSTGSYAFTWTAPATAGTYTMQAIGIVTNGGKPGVWGWAAPLAVTVAAATAAPVAQFAFSPASPIAGATVTFTDTSTGSPTSWSWAFGDGGTSTAQNPVHTFASAGTFDVALTATNASGSSTRTQTITVAALPTVAGTWILPSSARASGVNAFWTTDLVVMNLAAESATVRLKFLGHMGAGSAGPEKTYTLPAHATQTFTDVLSSVFGLEADWGPILVRATVATLAVQGQTWTAATGGGTYGQSVPALGATETIGAAAKAITGVRQGSGFRTNLVLANLKETAATVSLALLLPDGTTSTSRTVDLGPWGFSQLNVETDLGVASISGRTFLVTCTTTDAQVAAYASVIDATTGDPRSILAR